MGITFYPAVAAGMPSRAQLRVSSSSTAQSFPSGVATTIGAFNTIATDNYGKFGGGSTYTIPVSGIYTISCSVRFSSSAMVLGTIAALTLQVNGGGILDVVTSFNPAVTGFLDGPCLTTTLALNAGAAVTIIALQTSGNTLTLNGSAGDNWMTIVQVD